MTQRKHTLTKDAKKQLKDIFEHSRVNYGLENAKNYTDKFSSTIKTLAEMPYMGRSYEATDGILYRKYLEGSYIIFYVIFEDRVEVAAILHQHSDYTKYFAK